jgi:ATP-dependent Lhr-like helicase
MLTAPMFGARWRWNATRSLAILRFAGGKRVPTPLQRMKADDLLASVFPDQVACAENLTGPIRIPDHPLVDETIDNCLHEAMDIDGLRRVLEEIERGSIQTVAIDTVQASLFSHEILNANPYAFLDDAPLEERRTRAVQLRQTLGTDVTGGEGVLDLAAIDQISAESWPEARDADELHDALLTLVNMPPAAELREFFDDLAGSGRTSTVERNGAAFWAATERLTLAHDADAVVGGWMESLGPVTTSSLAERLAFPVDVVEAALARLEGQGQALRGHFRNKDGEIEWCNRRILARIHRATLGRLRREIEPVTALDFERFLQAWQHVSPGGQLHGADGTLQIIRQLQGYEIPASAWESEILASRIGEYDPEFLDELCFSGEVMWARVSPHPAIVQSRRVRPTRIAPITLFLREDADWLMSGARSGGSVSPADSSGLSHAARDVLLALERNGASFFVDLARQTGRLASEVEDGLWELLAGGFVTADGFDNLRALIDPKRRRGEGRANKKRPRHAAGRWALLRRGSGSVNEEERVQRFARLLLLRWGVLLRDLLVRETLAPPWRDLLPALRRMEARGEIRGGRFVGGFTGEQFARPEALELLRAIRRNSGARPTVAVSSADPLNLTGIILPGPRVSRLAVMGRVSA